MGAQIGIQYASSALAGVIAGATIGSTIPGLGTVIGIGMGLAFQAAIAPKVHPYQQPCPKPYMRCPITAGIRGGAGGSRFLPPESPMDLLPWVAHARVALSVHISRKQMSKYCGKSPDIDCLLTLGQVARNAYKFAENTPQVLGLPQVQEYLKKYRNATRFVGEYYNPKTRRIEPSVGEVGQRFIPDILRKLEARERELLPKVALSQRMMQLTPRELSGLHFWLITELRNAAMQATIAPSPQSQQWLTTMKGFMDQWSAANRAITERMRQQQAAGRQRFEQRRTDTGEQKKHVLQQLQFQCGQGNQGACGEYRRIAGGGALTAAQLKQFAPQGQRGKPPVVSPRQPAKPAPKKPDPKLFAQCYKIVSDLVNKNPRARKCITRSDLHRMAQICTLAYPPFNQITQQQALVKIAQYADAVCKRKGL
jgi:hypothetical protein